MGPPELPGGNHRNATHHATLYPCFNGAAGITRRKRAADRAAKGAVRAASMGPPELPGGNTHRDTTSYDHKEGFNGAAGITRRKRL